MAPLPFAAVREAALAVLPSLLIRWLPDGKVRGREFIARNPTRNDHKAGSFQINTKTGRWIDFATDDKGGDPTSLYAYLAGLGQAEACRELAAELGIDVALPPPRRQFGRAPPPEEADRLEADEDRKRRRFAQELWIEAGPPAGTAVERYLRGRGITFAIPRSLRHGRLKHPDTGPTRHPCMVGAMQVGRDICGIHRTYLTEDGGKAELGRVKLMLGHSGGAAVRLSPTGRALMLAEGIETALSALQLCPGWTVWAALSAGNISRVAIPPGIELLVIVADPDCKPEPRLRGSHARDPRAMRRVGIQEARKALAPLGGLGIRAHLVELPGNRDLNDVLRDDPPLARRFAQDMAARLAQLEPTP